MTFDKVLKHTKIKILLIISHEVECHLGIIHKLWKALNKVGMGVGIELLGERVKIG